LAPLLLHFVAEVWTAARRRRLDPLSRPALCNRFLVVGRPRAAFRHRVPADFLFVGQIFRSSRPSLVNRDVTLSKRARRTARTQGLARAGDEKAQGTDRAPRCAPR